MKMRLLFITLTLAFVNVATQFACHHDFSERMFESNVVVSAKVKAVFQSRKTGDVKYRLSVSKVYKDHTNTITPKQKLTILKSSTGLGCNKTTSIKVNRKYLFTLSTANKTLELVVPLLPLSMRWLPTFASSIRQRWGCVRARPCCGEIPWWKVRDRTTTWAPSRGLVRPLKLLIFSFLTLLRCIGIWKEVSCKHPMGGRITYGCSTARFSMQKGCRLTFKAPGIIHCLRLTPVRDVQWATQGPLGVPETWMGT